MKYSAFSRDLMLLAIVAVLFLAGCGGSDGPRLAAVEGPVTLDGQPLPGASVVFQPEQGRPSVGETDDAGRYTLQYTQEKPGTIVGKHLVSISTFREADPDADDPQRREERSEKVPARYNVEAEDNPEMTVEVTPGSNTHDFKLSSEGKIVQARPDDDD